MKATNKDPKRKAIAVVSRSLIASWIKIIFN
jgi:hypothetical protein